MRTSLNHQPEAQHPKSSAIHKLAGRLPHLPKRDVRVTSAYPSISDMTSRRGERRFGPIPDKEVANAINGSGRPNMRLG